MILLLQSILTAFILYIIYFITGPAQYVELEAINELIYLAFIPVSLIAVTIVLCFLIGLPLRIFSSLNRWWKSKQLIIAFAIAIMTILSITSLQIDFPGPVLSLLLKGNNLYDQTYDWINSGIIYWFLTAFGFLHFYPGIFFKQVKKMLQRL